MSKLKCNICRVDEGGESYFCALPCGHTYHGQCISIWLQRSQTCPHCRVSSRPEQVIKLYFDLAEDNDIVEIETLKTEVQRLKASLERTQSDFKVKSDDCKTFYRQLNVAHKTNEVLRKEAKVLNTKIDKLKAIKLEFGRQKTELKLALSALERERAKGAQLSNDIQKYQKIKTLLDGSVEEAISVITSDECVDFETMKVCFMTMKRDFRILTQSEAKLKTDYSALFSLYKALERTNSTLSEKCSVQERVIENYQSNLKSAPNVSLPIENSFESRMDVDEANLEPNPAKKMLPRRSPRNMKKRSALSVGTKIPALRQLSYDGLGGHSAEDKFPSAKLRPCRIVSNRRK